MTKNYKIRPAGPKDAPKVARLVYLANESHLKIPLFDYIFCTKKDETIAILEKMFLSETRSYHHWSHCLVAEIDGEIAATMTGYAEAESGTEKLVETIKEVISTWPIEKIMAMKQRAEAILRVKQAPPRNAWIIEFVATFPEYRRRGLIHSLFDTVLKKGREKGFKSAQISFIDGNIEAERAYEKAGFKLLSQFTDKTFEAIFGSPGLKIFSKDL